MAGTKIILQPKQQSIEIRNKKNKKIVKIIINLYVKILTIDLEDWFHINFEKCQCNIEWETSNKKGA